MGAEVVMVARDRARGEAALRNVQERSGSGNVSLLLCDLGSLASVRALADSFRSAHPQLHILINNAGSVSTERRETADVRRAGRSPSTTAVPSYLAELAPQRRSRRSAPAAQA